MSTGTGDQQTIESVRNVVLARREVAMIRMDSERTRGEAIGHLAARGYRLPAVGADFMPAMKVKVVRPVGAVRECNLEPIAFGGPKHRAGHRSAERPGIEPVVGGDADLLVDHVEPIRSSNRAGLRKRSGWTSDSVERERAEFGGGHGPVIVLEP